MVICGSCLLPIGFIDPLTTKFPFLQHTISYEEPMNYRTVHEQNCDISAIKILECAASDIVLKIGRLHRPSLHAKTSHTTLINTVVCGILSS